MRCHPNIRLTEISAEMDLPKFTISRVLSKLETKGYISKIQDIADRRNYRLQLEDKSKQVILAIETANFTRISTNIQGFSQSEMARFVEVAENLPIVLGVSDKISIE